MALVNSINFLPPVFRTTTNAKFLGATMDQLVADAVNIPVNGYIGRTFAPTYKIGDNYVPETDTLRKNYQLEPSVVVTNDNKNVVFNTGFVDLLNSIKNYGGLTDNQQRLFSSETYTYDGQFNYDKFVNYYNYYWLPNGPAAVNVYGNQAPYADDYTVTRNTAVGGYTFSTRGHQPNTQLTLVRGGTYTFNVDQPGYKFWIQSIPGLSGLDPNVNTVSTRDVFGVTNNGTDKGTVTFRVPPRNSQDFYTTMRIISTVDAAVTFKYTEIQNRLLSDFLADYPLGLDGINSNLQNKTMVFVGNDLDDSYWTTPTVEEPYTSLDSASIRPGDVIDSATRTGTWKVTLVAIDADATDYIVQIAPLDTIDPRQKVFIGSGITYAANQFWLTDNRNYELVPLITASSDILYYQDSANPGFVGEIKLIDNVSTTIDINSDIIGKVGYTSPNGVVFTNGLKIQFDSLVTPAEYTNNEYYVDGVGTAITLTPVSELLVPEEYGVLLETDADYITVNRGSQDRNAWSRSNRWFHRDVIADTAKYNDTAEDFGPSLPGRRPIIEFDANLQLFAYGRQAKKNVDLITFTDTDAFGLSVPGTRVEGQVTAVVNGVTLAPGHRVIFAKDYDLNVKSKVWEVTVIEGLGTGENYINLVEASDSPVLAGENVLSTEGDGAGETYRFDGTNWFLCQPKAGLNQFPTFEVVDKDGYSFSDATVYPNSTFAGNKIFNYYPNTTGNNDTVLGFPLRYQNFNNIGDIVFKNYYDTESFTYTTNSESGETATVNCNTGYLVKNNDLTSTEKLNTWKKQVEGSGQYQMFTKFFDGRVLEVDGVNRAFVQIDVLPSESASVPHLKVYKNNVLLTDVTDYELTTYGLYNIVIFMSTPEVGDKLDVLVFSDETSAVAYYEVPKNLDQNPLNEKFSTIALGQIRTHYNKLLENISESGRANQDIYVKAQGGTLSQHSGPLIYAMTFLNDPLINFVNGLDLAKKEYTRFKTKFLNLCSTLPGLDYNNPMSGVDAILQNINAVKNNSFPWYYSDMVPQGGNYTTIQYTVLNIRQRSYEISSIFDTSQLSNRAVLIWHTSSTGTTQLTLGSDYTFSTTVPSVVFSKTFAVGDVITIRDYFDTDGNFIPETPTKLGLYPKSEPLIYEDNTYQTPTNVIRGHDGSLTPVFGDFRDDYLLELERRIYNNIKADYSKNIIDLYDIIPGKFRTTDYSHAEFTQILSQNFLQWAGANNVDYTTNSWYDANNAWTWNYDEFTDIIDNKLLQGSWRAIYQYWYDTDQPNIAPWQMLGFRVKPSWWETRYGPGPYTSGNFTLWEDLEVGYIWNNGNAYYDERFARPGLTGIIPVDSAGNLLPPTDINLIKTYNLTSGGNNFIMGHQGPVETAWRRSSDFPFAMQLTLALCKPATYFGTQYDTSRFYVNDVSTQLTDINNQKIAPENLYVNGDTTTGTVIRTSGYVNWIADSIKNLGMDPAEKIYSYLQNLSVKLNYKVGGFIDKNILTVTAEQTAPGTTRGGVIIPDNNYSVYLNKSIPVSTATYSAVIVQRTPTGYSVVGYDTTNPFFTILPSIVNANAEEIGIDEVTVKLYQDARPTPVLVPYGTTYANTQELSDFLISYERYLVSQGFKFEVFDSDLQAVRDFKTSVREFLFWSQQGWEVGTLIILNPTANRITLNTVGLVVDEIKNTSSTGRILDQNFLPIKSSNFNLLRTENPLSGNFFNVTSLNGTGICFAHLHLVQFEHVLIIDNESDFNDIIYVPSQGLRQARLRLAGYKTGAWTGALSAAGYVYNTAEFNEWIPGRDYEVGDIVTFNNNYYTALKAIPASTKFDITNWSQILKSDIKTGLLPSFGLQAQQFDSIYNVDRPPSDENLQLFSGGLIGFRPRSYLTDLGISIPNQTKFYQGYIKEKGSLNSITALTKANFNNVNGQIATYEEWGFKVGDYGDLDGNLFREFVLDQSVFNTNPVAFKLSDTYSTDNIIVDLKIDSNLTLSNVYNSSNLSNLSTSIYANRNESYYKNDLPTAGFVHLDDTDLSIFNLNTYQDSPNVGVGDKVWTAKDINNQWNVYRVSETTISATSLTYVLDNYAELEFDNPHGFDVDDLIILKGFTVNYFDNAVLENFSTNYDAVYRVINVVNLLKITVQIVKTDVLNNLIVTSPVISNASVYKLESAKIPTIEYIESMTPINGWINNDRVWVETATDTNGWGVYSFNKSWPNTTAGNLKANTATANDLFGYQNRISSSGQYVYVSNPGEKQIQVFANVNNSYVSNVTVSNTDAKFGSVFDSQGNLLVVASANYIHVYRHNDNYTSTEASVPWQANAYVTNGVAWTPNTVFAVGTQITNSGNNYVTTGNVYAPYFANVSANVLVRPVIAVDSLITNGGNTYITTGNVYNKDAFSNIVANVRQINLTSTRLEKVQTISAGNIAGNISSISISADQTRFVVGGNNQIKTFYIKNHNTANVVTVLANVVANTGAFGNVVKMNADGSKILVSAATTTDVYTQNGVVYYCTANLTTDAVAITQTIKSKFKNNTASFGTSLAVDSNFSNVFVGAPHSIISGFENGLVEHWTFNGSQYIHKANILHPKEEAGLFGTAMSISSDAKVLAVGSVGSPAEETTVFDNSTTVIDQNSTKFIDVIPNSGSVYIFEPLINLANTASISYSFTQELETGLHEEIHSGDNFGASIDLNRNLILVGAPSANVNSSIGAGIIYTFRNLTETPAWALTRSQQPTVDVDSINRTFIYNKTNNNIITSLDVVDPIKGKILTGIATDIDYRLDHDPATYNVGTNAREDFHWGPDQVGRIWWNLNNIRYIDYEQDSLIYRLNHWGNTFPGSQVEVYEWVESTVLPSQFVANGGSGVPLYADDSAYSTYGYVDQSGTVRVKYYFWVGNRDQANTKAGKTNSVVAITSAIENPQNQDIPYITVLRNDTVALYNIKNLLVGTNSVLHLGTQSENAGLIHSEYILVQEKSPNSQLPGYIIDKMIDSLAEQDAAGNPVPDPALPASQRYGVNIRPRQTMFTKLEAALINIGTLVNERLYSYPVTQRKVLTLMNSEESAPSTRSGHYDTVVDTKIELGYIDTNLISAGYRVLVNVDTANLGKWAIYEWSGTEWSVPTRDDGTAWIQSYKTNLYWNYADWYDASFDPTTVIDITVADNLEFGKLTLTPDTYIKVLNAGNDKFAIYYINSNLERVTVGLQDGTLLLPDARTTIPGKEFRQIMKALQTEIFIDDLSGTFNEIFFSMVKFALAEQKNLDWVFKTSFISATQYIRKLEQFPSYIADNQDFYKNYIEEVKPYRTILREFNINYQRDDMFDGDISDFDIAPYWDSNINVYRSPNGEQSYDAELLNNEVYRDWKNNYTYKVVDVVVGKAGSGFVTAPQILITGGGGSGANAVAQIDAYGTLSNITIVNPGSGYTSTPTITINGTGSGAVATAVLRNVFDGTDSGHNVVRSISTNMKFDRVTYDKKRPIEWANAVPAAYGLTSSNAVVMWDEVTAGQVIAGNTYINLNDDLYQLSQFPHTVSVNIDFPIANVTAITGADLTTAIDRITAYHGNIDLSATSEGIDYPGIVVDGSNYFAYDSIVVWTPNTTIVSGTQISYSGNVYTVNGNVSSPLFSDILGNVTQVPGEKIDAIIQSRYADNLGVDAGNIYVDGGAYVDTFSSHAPEELVPGRMFDSVNLQVFSNVTPNTNDYAFRLFDNMTEEHSFYRISNSTTTTLSEDLLITDDKIIVTDATVLPSADRVNGIPGVVFVNGEKITYYRNYSLESVTTWAANTVIANDTLTSFNGNYYLTTGNVYAPNTIWAANTQFATNSYFYYGSNTYRVVGNVKAPYFANIVANTALVYTTPASGFATVSANVTLIGSNVNILGQIRRAVDGTAPNNLNVIPWTVKTQVPVGSYVSYLGNTYITTGNVYAENNLWAPTKVIPTNSYFYFGPNVYLATGNVYATTGTPFANVSANASLVQRNRIDSGFFNISGNINLLYNDDNGLRHLANSRVVDASIQQKIPSITVSNVLVTAGTQINTTSNVSLKLRLVGNITANIGDYINQKFANTTVAANLRVLETVTSSSNVAVIKITGNITALAANTVTVIDRLSGNVTATNANVIYANVIGAVSSVGNVTVAADTYLTKTPIWYGNISSHYYGDTLLNSTSEQAAFLKASPGYIP